MTTTVTAVLVSRDGGRWLSAALDALGAQTHRPDRVVAVDTGSTDGSADLLRDRLGADGLLDGLVDAPPASGFGESVTAALAAAPDAGTGHDDWVWLLHDDAAPAPDALEQLLAVAADRPDADLLGPKLREWPSLRRLLEVGVTLSGTGRRETGLERGEYDQGQHDEVREVLAVNTAGMLVRRPVLDALGLDPRLPVFGNDIDLGWRAARAGHRVLVAPEAVVFHVEAAHRGVRRTTLTGAFRRQERAAYLYVLLVNGPARWLPFRVVRLLLGSLVRALGLVLVRAPGEAADELAGLASVYLRPGRVVAGRRERRVTATVPHRQVRHLLAPAWLPYRHGLDAVGDLLTAVAHQAGDVSEARHARRPDRPDRSRGARLVTSPVTWVFTALVLAALVAARGLVGGGSLSGGALLPAPDSALDWWRGYLAGHHDVGGGSTAPAAAYLLPLAVAGTVLLGHASLLVDVLLLLAVPLAAWGGYRFLLRVTGAVPASLWGAAAYGLLPVLTGAVQQGRLGTVVGTVLLPWLAHSALFLAPSWRPDRRARAAWRCALWLALLTAFEPLAWPMAAVLGVVAVALTRGRLARGVLVPLVASLVLLLPWSLATWWHQGPASWLFEAGRHVPGLATVPDAWDLVLGRPGAGAPAWLSVGVLVAALAALLRPDTRPAVLRAWLVVVVALGTTAVLAAGTYATLGDPAEQPLWLGFPLVVAQAAGIAAAAIAGSGVRDRLTGSDFGWRQPLGVAVVVLALATPFVAGLWWVWQGSGGPLDRGRTSDVPAYMADAVADDPADGVLVVRGSRQVGFTYLLLRQPGVRLGDDAVLPAPSDQAALTRTVANLASAPTPDDVRRLSRDGVAYVYAPAPADPSLVGNLDSVSGLSQGSATGAGSRAWQLEATPGRSALTQPGDPWRPWLLLVQGLAILVVVVLAVPSRRERR